MTFDRRRYGKDNYTYLLAAGGDAALVDPGDPDAALALAAAHGVRPRWILHTHGHADHTGGTAAVARALGARVLGHGGDAERFRPDVDLAGRAEVALGALALRVHPVPGHTPGSVLLEWEGRLLTGDTLFWAGCGNCRHGGDPARLAESFLGPIARLDGALEVHPGHDYAAPNLAFALALEPDGAAARARLAEVEAAHAAGREPAPGTLAGERAVNPFLRLDAPGVAAAVARADPAAAAAGPVRRFVALRALRDRA
ncbi:Hydroxyacylglutathione hydrolase [Anaeromyxobacter dehalogenans 2CP-1]|uniref:Hydroxyacylglutathione hydrolase n=1 Tax=Anaeromyxobacter dehalogenans (strain ATCC BAA-258 / DSM 21875 / 2CP-1) TaxID=455488 RepID=B8J821_ANAD2|nr:hydroxyacylglutathione hydrolase C-terminal domain-containing protein [Anaeromyxobacter dehalogenans]ACL65320.1 Hydroxyacylglutathione hydrolase [Anaeromyxobacter dehalogenans 2CP-1]